MKLEIEYLPIEALRAYGANARTHSATQLDELAASIRQFGFTSPILVDEQREIIAGHGRLEAAKAAGLEKVPTITLRGLSPEQVRALRLADNQISQHSGWDLEQLAAELEDLKAADFDLGAIGFDDAFLASLSVGDQELSALAQNVGEMRDWGRPKPPKDLDQNDQEKQEPQPQPVELDEEPKFRTPPKLCRCPKCGFDFVP